MSAAKSSPLALLAAHCSKIGTSSPPPPLAAAAVAASTCNWLTASFPKFEEPLSCYQQFSTDCLSSSMNRSAAAAAAAGMIHCPSTAVDVFPFQDSFFGSINDIFPAAAYIKGEPPPPPPPHPPPSSAAAAAAAAAYCPNLNKSPIQQHPNPAAATYNAAAALSVGYQQVCVITKDF